MTISPLDLIRWGRASFVRVMTLKRGEIRKRDGQRSKVQVHHVIVCLNALLEAGFFGIVLAEAAGVVHLE